MDIIQHIKFDNDNLIPAIVQDTKGIVLMLGYMNIESVKKTLETGIIYFWSRSRKKLWRKGESSGHIQKLIEIRIDCDMDTLLFIVEQTKACCHRGYYSCFWRRLENGKWKVVEKKIFNPEKVYK